MVVPSYTIQSSCLQEAKGYFDRVEDLRVKETGYTLLRKIDEALLRCSIKDLPSLWAASSENDYDFGLEWVFPEWMFGFGFDRDSLLPTWFYTTKEDSDSGYVQDQPLDVLLSRIFAQRGILRETN